MPKMDGFETTKKLRQQEKFYHLPIIALTANVSESDRQDCLNAGMDDFLGKPFKLNDIAKMLSHFLQHKQSDSNLPEDTQDNTTQHLPAIDPQRLELLKQTMGDFFKELAPGYTRDMKNKFEKIDQFLKANNSKELHILAHSIKGSSSNIGAMPLSNIAKKMEMQAKNKQIQALAVTIQQLKSEYSRVKQALENI